jgi:hypothetical protein
MNARANDAEREVEFDAISESDIFEEAKDRLQIAIEAESQNRTRAKDDLMFRRGKQWEEAMTTTMAEDQIELTINLTDAFVRRVVNNIKQQRPRGKAHPVGDGADVDKAEVINGIGRHIEARSEASIAYDMAADYAATMGWGYVRMRSEYVSPDSFDQDIRIDPVFNPFSVYMDPAAQMPTASDAEWCLITTLMKRTEYKRLYPRAENAQWLEGSREEGYKDWENKEEIRLAEYFRIREKREKLYEITRKDGSTYVQYERNMPSPEAMRLLGDAISDERDSSRRQVEWFRLNGRKVVDRLKIPGDWIPVIRCQGNAVDIDGQIERWGMVDPMKDSQRMVNFGEVAKIKRLGLTPKAPWVGAEGQFDGHPEWDDSNRVAYAKLTYKPIIIATAQGDVLVPPPVRQPPAQIEAGFSEFVQGMRTNLLAIAGMPNEPDADQQGQVVSGRAIQRRNALSDMSHYQYYDNQTLMIAQVWRIMLQWIPHYFSTQRMQRIIGEDSQPQMIAINQSQPSPEDPTVIEIKNDLSVGRYDVVMDTGPGYDTKREEGSENLLELMKNPALAQLVAQHGADLVFRSMDHPYMQELADRFAALTPEGLQKVMADMPDRAKALIKALQQQNTALQKQLQAAQSGITKAHLDATVKAHDVEESNKTKRLDTIVKSHTALAVAEIQAGGKILDTHAKGGHDERQAQMMIEQAERAEKTNGSGNGNGSG